ncbi:hypothetical protein L2E82_20714 [Cichorium intybus]|uniref:Uncharacterized protein n=1 Tax=Cichorium intybus TaxID=13427 RepID=A0ACB9DTT2_CICIN|nr:hypothetical protein L2E82_20714 [Cichorium intybus]
MRCLPLMYKHLMHFINLVVNSPVKDIKDQAYVLAQAATLSTGAFDSNKREVNAWKQFRTCLLLSIPFSVMLFPQSIQILGYSEFASLKSQLRWRLDYYLLSYTYHYKSERLMDVDGDSCGKSEYLSQKIAREAESDLHLFTYTFLKGDLKEPSHSSSHVSPHEIRLNLHFDLLKIFNNSEKPTLPLSRVSSSPISTVDSRGLKPEQTNIWYFRRTPHGLSFPLIISSSSS